MTFLPELYVTYFALQQPLILHYPILASHCAARLNKGRCNQDEDTPRMQHLLALLHGAHSMRYLQLQWYN
jgi:hypothetical protein